MRELYRLIVLLLLGFSACQRDECDPPFYVGAGPSNVPLSGPVDAGTKFMLVAGVHAQSVAKLDDVEIKVELPPEVDSKTMYSPESSFKMTQSGNSLKWKGDINRTAIRRLLGSEKIEEIVLQVESRKNWSEWTYPIRVTIGLNYETSRECVGYPSGYYRKTTIWSHTGFSNPDWETAPDGYVRKE